MLEALREVYRFDAGTKTQKMTPATRLAHHQTHGAPVLAALKASLAEKIDGKHVEPNSGLGRAIGYMRKHWEPLHVAPPPGRRSLGKQPLRAYDQNGDHASQKQPQLQDPNGARIGDLFMSLIHPCRLSQVNPFDYLLAMANHPEEVKALPPRPGYRGIIRRRKLPARPPTIRPATWREVGPSCGRDFLPDARLPKLPGATLRPKGFTEHKACKKRSRREAGAPRYLGR